MLPHHVKQDRLTRQEREQAIEEERSLLSDSHVLPAGYGNRGRSGTLSQNITAQFSRKLSSSATDVDGRVINQGETTAPAGVPTEGTPLMEASRGDPSDNQEVDEEEIDKTWEEAIMAGLIQTTWRREAQVIGKYTAPLMVTFLLQYSLTVASIFTLGHMGKEQLSAVTLASMTANITGYVVYQGLATSLDTLCAQAYGSGKKKLVGLQLQRMVWFLMVITIPIAVVWFFSDRILVRLIPESEVAMLAGRYLKIVLLGAPRYACFESGKRYVQAQGLFSAATYVLLICAPLNALMNWLFVWVSR